jgi:fructose-1,6-bisphosphatase I
LLAPLYTLAHGQTLEQVLRGDDCPWPEPGVQLALSALASASVQLGLRLAKAGLDGSLGRAHKTNGYGDDVQKLDAVANTLFCGELSASRTCIAIASEELDTPIVHEGRHCRCSVMIDPLDGSSNLDPGLSVGSIFALFSDVQWPSLSHAFLRPGRQLAAAGYVLYGPRTTLVLASRDRVLAFTLDQDQYRLTHPELRCPEQGAQYCVNEANQSDWAPATQRWLAARRVEAPGGQRATLRYSGALVADAHRTLLSGGVFAYPGSVKQPRGKLRLLYEVNPIAFVFEAAGGAASNGAGSPLDHQPQSISERSPLVLGSSAEVAAFERALP